MLENSIYSVISPEGCASILWRDQSKSLEAAKAMKLTASELLKMKIIDEIIIEPTGGAHRNKKEVIISIEQALKKYLDEFKNLSREEIINHRRNKFLQIGKHKPFRVFSGDDVNFKKNILSKLNKKIIAILLFVAILGFFLI